MARTHRADVHWPMRMALCVLLVATCLAALADLARGAAFQPGDVFFAAGAAPVSEYTPTGALVQTLPGTSGASVLCFDPASGDLILPGVGLFGSSGNELPSSWGSVTGAGRCVADGRGNVYVSINPPALGLQGVISKYDLEGVLLHTFSGLITTALEGSYPIYLGLGPDLCTIYYGTYASDGASINVCTGTQQTQQPGGGDDVRVFPAGGIVTVDDKQMTLVGAAGNLVVNYPPTPGVTLGISTLSLDPDGTSFWLASAALGPHGTITRFDSATGRILAQWPGLGAIAVYPGPPPASTGAPQVKGIDARRYTLIASTGSWSANPTLYTYQWEDCDSLGNNCTGIAGATASYFTLTSRDVGHTIRVIVTALNNMLGSGTATSAQTGAVLTTPPPGTPPPTPPPAPPGAPGTPGVNAVSGVAGFSIPSAQMRTWLSPILVPRGKGAKIRALLSHGGYSFTWTAPSAGRLTISWYQVPNGAHLSRTRMPLLVATVSRDSSHYSKATLTIALTRAGRRLLKSARQLKLTAKASFVGKHTTTVIKSFILTR